jgi:hypothetical protein
MFKQTNPALPATGENRAAKKSFTFSVRTNLHAGANDWACYSQRMKVCESVPDAYKLDCATNATAACFD